MIILLSVVVLFNNSQAPVQTSLEFSNGVYFRQYVEDCLTLDTEQALSRYGPSDIDSMESFVEENIDDCIYSEQYLSEYYIDAKIPNSKISISDDRIISELDYNIKLSNSNQAYNFKDFEIQIPRIYYAELKTA